MDIRLNRLMNCAIISYVALKINWELFLELTLNIIEVHTDMSISTYVIPWVQYTNWQFLPFQYTSSLFFLIYPSNAQGQRNALPVEFLQSAKTDTMFSTCLLGQMYKRRQMTSSNISHCKISSRHLKSAENILNLSSSVYS